MSEWALPILVGILFFTCSYMVTELITVLKRIANQIEFRRMDQRERRTEDREYRERKTDALNRIAKALEKRSENLL